MFFCYYDSPVGRLLVGGEQKLEFIHFPKGKSVNVPAPDWINETQPFSDVLFQLDRYFSKTLTRFSLEYSLGGTPFQRRVWQTLAKVPYGTTISYGELARRIGNPNAARAVGMANAKNPIPIIIPCHRIIKSDGNIGEFGSGRPMKKALLEMEGVQLRNETHVVKDNFWG